MSLHHRSTLILVWLAAFSAEAATAQFQPIGLSSDSFNEDMIVERNAPGPVLPVTTASMEAGFDNSGFTWFERGYVSEWLSAGLPPAGSTFLSASDVNHQYRMPPSYHENNAILIDAQQSNAMITLVAPTNYSNLSLLTSSGGNKNVLGYSLRHQNGSKQTGTFTSANWYSVLDPAWAANGRVDVRSFVLSDVNSYNPKLYSVDLSVADSFNPVTAIELYYTNGTGHAAVFAVSGARPGAGPFFPIEIKGYNADVVVEATAPKPGFLQAYTTATMESGTVNLRFTWYEQGYNPLAVQTGLPAPGSLLTSETDPTHVFVMPPSYTTSNAVLLDTVCTNSSLTFLKPSCYSAISFLTASGRGPITNRCVFLHSDGTGETNRFVSPDWMGASAAALVAHGRVSISTKLMDQVNAESPRLYAVDVLLTNQSAPVAGILLSPITPPTDWHSIVLAVSGLVPDSTAIVKPSLLITRNADGTLLVRSTHTGRLQSCTSLAPGAAWRTEGSIPSTGAVSIARDANARFYRVVVP